MRAMRLLAEDIRRLRKSNGLTLAGLSQKLGRSVGWLSQVERGISLPTLADLRLLAGHFRVPVSFFFQPVQEDRQDLPGVVRLGAGRNLKVESPGVSRELVSPDLGGSFSMTRTVIDPGACWSRPADRRGEDAGQILVGRVEFTHAGGQNLLEVGDSFTVNEGEASWRNLDAIPATVLWISAPAGC
ncbi:Transcriptional regulator, XRE family [Nitratireductor basaltis]|uniref:Transcriptional regulator, XRE family n=2 Tax=Nitratireductor basaltis TaxID=472175 RepID=A0A084U9Y2_9HYPH|nr:Transcriptional regulator, XRE family [Nitratireductor basaltis]